MESQKKKKATDLKSKTSKKTTPRKTLKKTEITHDHIAQRAYEIYKGRGAVPGRELEDWIQAEKELLKKKK